MLKGLSYLFTRVLVLIATSFFMLTAVLAGGPALPPPQYNQIDNGPYVKAFVGGATYRKVDTTNGVLANGNPASQDLFVQSRNTLGFLVGGALGYRINPIWALALSYFYLAYDLETTNVNIVSPPNNFNVTSNTWFSPYSHIVLANVYIDLAALFHVISRLHPYIGAGLGWAYNTSGTARTQTQTSVSNSVRTDTDSFSRSDFAWRVIFGLHYILLRNLLVDMQYSYLDAGKYQSGSNNVTGTALSTNISKPNFYICANMITLGLTYIFSL